MIATYSDDAKSASQWLGLATRSLAMTPQDWMQALASYDENTGNAIGFESVLAVLPLPVRGEIKEQVVN